MKQHDEITLIVPNVFYECFIEALKQTGLENKGLMYAQATVHDLYREYDVKSSDPMFFYLLAKNYTIEKSKL